MPRSARTRFAKKMMSGQQFDVLGGSHSRGSLTDGLMELLGDGLFGEIPVCSGAPDRCSASRSFRTDTAPVEMSATEF